MNACEWSCTRPAVAFASLAYYPRYASAFLERNEGPALRSGLRAAKRRINTAAEEERQAPDEIARDRRVRGDVVERGIRAGEEARGVGDLEGHGRGLERAARRLEHGGQAQRGRWRIAAPGIERNGRVAEDGDVRAAVDHAVAERASLVRRREKAVAVERDDVRGRRQRVVLLRADAEHELARRARLAARLQRRQTDDRAVVVGSKARTGIHDLRIERHACVRARPRRGTVIVRCGKQIWRGGGEVGDRRADADHAV